MQWEVGNVAAAAGAKLRGWILEQQTESLGGLGGLAEQEILSRSMHDPAVPGRPRGRPS